MKIEEINFMVLAAGKSSRNYPHSKGLPHKSLLPFGSKKIIDYILSEIIAAGGKHITLVVSDTSAIDAFEENFAREYEIEAKFEKAENHITLELLKAVYLPEDVTLHYVIQKEPKGLAHAMALGSAQAPEKHLGVIFPDDLILSADGGSVIQKVVNQYVKDAVGGNLFLTREVEDVSRWGIIEKGYFREKPAMSESRESSIMFFILDQKVGAYIRERIVEDQKQFAQDRKELHYSTYLNEMIAQDPEGMKIRTLPLAPGDLYLDCGSIAGYEKALLYSLLKLSHFKHENLDYVKGLL